MSRLAPTFALAALLAGAFPAVAQEAASAVTGNINLTTKYKFRGQDQSDPARAVLPAVQGGFDYTSGGLYVGNWNSSIGFSGGTEMDFYGGWRGEASGVAYDVGVLYYYYPEAGSSGVNTTELYAGVTFGPVGLKYSHSVSEYFGFDESKNTGYLEANLNHDLGRGVTLNAHVGATRFPGDAKTLNGIEDYVDYKLGVTYDIGSGFAVAAAYVGANKRGTWGDINKNRLVVTLSKTL